MADYENLINQRNARWLAQDYADRLTTDAMIRAEADDCRRRQMRRMAWSAPTWVIVVSLLGRYEQAIPALRDSGDIALGVLLLITWLALFLWSGLFALLAMRIHGEIPVMRACTTALDDTTLAPVLAHYRATSASAASYADQVTGSGRSLYVLDLINMRQMRLADLDVVPEPA